MNIIVAYDEEYGIGKDNSIPWYCKDDMRFFKRITQNGSLVMGRNTWESLSFESRNSLSTNGRRCIVITSNPQGVECDTAASYEEAKRLALSFSQDHYNRVFFIGGHRVYADALIDPDVKNMYATRMDGSYECDVVMPYFDEKKWYVKYKLQLGEHSVLTHFIREHEEHQYLDLLHKIVTTGSYLQDRTKTGIYSVFGAQMRFDCSEKFPLLTTKKTYFKGILHELLWFMKGETDSKKLEEVGVNIWKGNTSREYLDAHGFHSRDEGDIGPGYGHQWRHWNAKYTSPREDYTNRGIDQLKNCVESIKREMASGDHDRRNIMLAWNPEQIDEMSLPPCHILVQFYLENGNLSLHMYQRSADMFLGVPFNIASYALLLKIVAKLTDTKPRDLIMSFGDAHVYSNHVDAVYEQLQNSPYPFPTVEIDVNTNTKITDITPDMITIKDYTHHKPIKAPMAI